ncbi:hypothetical protein N9Y89_01600 [bacterium]|nr:hypothetical protein [bacterium]
MAKHSKGMDASEINRLMSISNIKSTIEGDYTSYYSVFSSTFSFVIGCVKSLNAYNTFHSGTIFSTLSVM